MNKILIRFLLLVFILLHTSSALFSDNDDLSNWEFYKHVDLIGENKYKYFFLVKEVYAYVREDLADLRIADNNGDFVPYYISREFSEEETEESIFHSAFINSFNNKEGDGFFDFYILPEQGEIKGKMLLLKVYEDNYSKQIEVYGRDEKTDWTFLVKDTIYNINEFIKNEVELDYLEYYHFYRIKIIANNNDISISDLKLYYNTQQSNYYNFIKEVSLDFNVENKDKISTIHVFNPYHLRILNLKLSTKGIFNRNYEVLEESEEGFSLLKKGSIFSLDFKEVHTVNTTITLGQISPYKDKFFIKINNYDDKPITIDEIKARYLIDKIVFEDTGNGPYRLYYGKIDAKKPTYDVESYKRYIEAENQDEVSLGETVIVKSGASVDTGDSGLWGIDFKVVFNVLMVIVVIAISIFLIFVLKKK